MTFLPASLRRPHPAYLLACTLLPLVLLGRQGYSQTTSVTLSGLTNNDYSADISGTLEISMGFMVDYLVVGGGGGGAGRDSGGGGGGGGVLTNGGGSIFTNFTIGQNGLPVSSGTYSVTVGAGGAGSPNVQNGTGTGSAGGNSIFGSLTAVGGGGGGNFASNGAPGGSGGGGGREIVSQNIAGQGGAGTAGPPRQGFNGGNGSNGGDFNVDAGGGGGGAGGAGGTAVKSASAGSGGAGIESTIVTGSSRFYAGGGGGAAHRSSSISSGAGGSGVGGAGAPNSSTAPGSGVANSGGGGGASRSETGTGGSGGSGTVAIRYVGPSIASGITGGSTTSYTFGGFDYTLHLFETVGDGSLTLDTSNPNRLNGGNFGTLTGSGAVVFNGPGQLTLFRNNTYSGGTTVSAGTLVVGQLFVGATLNTGSIGAGPVSIAAGAMLTYERNYNETFPMANTYTGSGTLQVRGVGTGELGSNAAGFDGTVWVRQGSLKLLSADALGTTAGETWLNPNFVALGGMAFLDLNGQAIVGETLRVGDGTQDISSLPVENNSTTAASWSGPIITDCKDFVLNAAQGDITVTGTISGNANLSKFGLKKLTLTAANTYSGSTTLGVGTLVVNGRTGTGEFESWTNTRLEGTGTIVGPATIAGTHAPGNSPGIQTFESDLTYDNGTVEWELLGNTITGRGTAYDGIDVGGDLLFAADTINHLDLIFNAPGSVVDWTDPFWGADRSWLLFDVAGSTLGLERFLIRNDFEANLWLDSLGETLASLRPGSTFTLSQAGSDVMINYVHPVPEPTGIGLLAGAALAAAAAQRGSRRSMPRTA